jgi:hypothetical protein
VCASFGRKATLDPDHLLDCPHDGGFQWKSAWAVLSNTVDPRRSLDFEIPEWKDESQREISILKTTEAIQLSHGTLSVGEGDVDLSGLTSPQLDLAIARYLLNCKNKSKAPDTKECVRLLHMALPRRRSITPKTWIRLARALDINHPRTLLTIR